MRKPRNAWSVRIGLAGGAAVMAVLSVAFGNADAQVSAPPQWDAQPGEVLVGLRTGSVLRLRFTADVAVARVMAEYRRRPDVAFVEPNFRVHTAAFPSDPDFSKQWYLAAIGARDAWSAELLYQEGRQVKAPVIAVLDTGVDVDQPELREKIWTNVQERPGDRLDNDKNGYIDDWQGWDFISGTADPNPKFDNGYSQEAIHHGTIIAGIAAADSHNGIGISGVSWTAKIMALRVLDAEGNGTIYDVLRAVEYATEKKADVINLSFVGVEFSQALHDALQSAAAQGVVVVAAAGNTPDRRAGVDLAVTPAYPICLDAQDAENFILGVAAVNQQRQLASFSNFGQGCVDLVAPGQDFYGLLVQEPGRSGFGQTTGGTWSGTSVATPLVSGAAAIARAIRPDLNASAIRDILLQGVDGVAGANPGRGGQIGQGQINLVKVVNQAIVYRSAENRSREAGGLIVAGLGYGSFPQIKLFTGKSKVLKSFFAYAPAFTGGIVVAAGDVIADAEAEIVTGVGPGGGPHVRIFNREGHVLGQFYAFDRRLRHGVNVAVGNLDGKGKAEIVVAPLAGGPPVVAVYTAEGERLSSWLAYPQNFRGGVSLATGDVDGDGVDEIITGAGAGGGPQVRVFTGAGRERFQFFAFNAISRFGVTVAAGDLDGDGTDEIIAAIPRGAAPLVRVFSPHDQSRVSEFYAYGPSFLDGVHLAAGDVDGDGTDEIITGAGARGGPHVRMFNLGGAPKGEFFAHDASYRGGVRVAFLKNSSPVR